jgi:ligand-binding sensor domain-containing protein
MKTCFGLMGLALLLAGAMHFGCSFANMRAPVRVEPEVNSHWTTTRSVTSLMVDNDGVLWAATMGGVLRRTSDGIWTKYAQREGLPSGEARKVFLNEKVEVEVLLPRFKATWRDEKWLIGKSAAPPNAPQAVDVAWNDEVVQTAPELLRIRPQHSMKWKAIALPTSRGSHVSALLARGEVLWCALYGDGLWSYDGESWQRLDIALPKEAREITALAFDEKTKTLWLGTRRNGIWQYSLAGWNQHLQSDEPLDHNAQYLQMFGGDLYISTLDDGLQVRDSSGWHALGASTLSSSAPRHLVEFQNQLYVRHGGGKVDRFDGKDWTRDVFSQSLPRGKAFALAADNEKLYVAQWGGWSEWDGENWTHFLKIPELQGLPVMAILPLDDTVWIGTQSRGVAEYSRVTKTLKWHDERNGLSDDWITCLAKCGKMLYAGTFVGGLAMFDGAHWKTVKQLDGENVTDVKEDGQGTVLIATRSGVWRRGENGVLTPLNQKHSWLDGEAQALCATQEGVWIGARTGLSWIKR